MTIQPAITATNNTTTAITLPGTAGAADGDMYLQMLGHSDLSIEQSANGSVWSSNVSNTPAQGVAIMVPAGASVRIRNSNAVTSRTAIVSYRYAGSPS